MADVEAQIEHLTQRVTETERTQASILTEIKNVGERFDRHEVQMVKALQSGSETMVKLEVGQARISESFISFCRWFKATITIIVSILLALLGASVTIAVAMGAFS